MRVTLEQAGQSFVVQPGRTAEAGWHFEFRKHLAADSQPFDVVATRTVGWRELPWRWMLGWALVAAALLAAMRSCGASALSAGARRNCCGWARWRA